ncbi:DNA-directed RNA polymerase subunit omega [Vagococcus penaei]|uniref:DNA-directed RNA polymerase subunit omega n=1 Tax=Vagococcus penaei TaxID=633807 RepID=A0A1Q2D6I3_9ENTE|nr:DNA-directed RNA polymerase subunit omega [Vagococcus penaei]AQP54056.1 DNA-directed RNA polymerase subunit omega [Vagococcus penaei]RSU01710.1 DNA-directed RNA polymerase subunit omega [Vagococcus penaei]
MLYPSIDLLLEQVDSKYSLVILSSKRAHELDLGAQPMIEKDKFVSVKNVGRALEEIAAGDVVIDPNPDLKRELLKRQEDEKKALKRREQQELEARIQLDNKL